MWKEAAEEAEQSEWPEISLVNGINVVTNWVPREAGREIQGQCVH